MSRGWMGAAGVVLLALCLPFSAKGQWSLTAGSLSTYDANSFRNHQQLPDWVQQVTAEVGRAFVWQKAEVSLGYGATGVFFRSYPDRRFLLQRASLDISLYPRKGAPPFLVSASCGWRTDEPAYSALDHQELEVQVGRAGRASDVPEVFAGYTRRIFPGLPEYSHSQWDLSLTLRHSFPSRTSLIVSPAVGYRIFAHKLTVVEVEDQPQMTRWRRWRRKVGLVRPGRSGTVQIVEMVSEIPEVALLDGQVRLGQALGQETGLSVEGEVWYRPSKASRSLTRLDYSYDPADVLSNDPYGFDGERVSARLTRIAWSGSEIELGASAERRKYRDTPAFDLQGETQLATERKDALSEFWLTWRISLGMKWGHLGALVDARWLRSRSNDPYHTWQGWAVSLGLNASR